MVKALKTKYNFYPSAEKTHADHTLNRFPTIGKLAKKVSNDWKNGPKSFQWLEKNAQKFPMIGKRQKKSSNDWKPASCEAVPLAGFQSRPLGRDRCLEYVACAVARAGPHKGAVDLIKFTFDIYIAAFFSAENRQEAETAA